MKTLLITNDWKPKKGGISTYLCNFVDNFPEETLIYGPNWIEGKSTFPSSSNFILPTKKTIDEITQIVEEKEVDNILMGSSNPQFLMVPFLTKLNIPISMIAHGAEFNVIRFIPVLGKIMSKSMDMLEQIYTISYFSLNKLEKLTSSKVLYIGAGTPTVESTPTKEFKEGERVVVGVSSRFVVRKRIEWVLEACSDLVEEGYILELHIYGHGRLESKLRKLSDLFSVKTSFFPSSEENDSIEDFYSNIDIFAMPSHSRFFGLEYEGLGLVYLEAASYGIPVITGSSGGSPETIIPGKTGFVADTKNHLYDAIKYFLDNPTSINEFGSEGKIFISNNFSWENVISKYRNTLGAHENSNKIEEE